MVLITIVAGIVMGQSSERMFNPSENYGKTAEQAVAMGHEKWYDFIIKKAGAEHTLSMSHANYSFGCALHDVNDGRLKSVAGDRQGLIRVVRPKMLEFSNSAISVGMVVSGGGTMWTLIGSGNLTDVEECVTDLIKPKAKMKTATQSQVWAKIAEAEKRMIAAKPEIDATHENLPYSFEEAQSSMKKMKFEWSDSLETITKFESAADRGRIMRVFYDAAETARWAGE
ncbi:MAG: hypothetical protein ACKVQS_08835 [Fimbriimonadaceae bacterium]